MPTEKIQDANFELVTTEKTAEAPLAYGGMLTADMIARAEAAVEGVRKVKAIAFKVTNHSDWTRMGGKAYLTESGAKKIASLFGVSFRDCKVVSEERTTDGVQVREYTARVTALFNGREITEIGTCDSEYDFWKWSGKDHEGNKIAIPFGERDFASMKKHAVTNALNRALKAILGLNGILWEEVEAALGREGAGKAASISYDKGGSAASKPAQTVAGAEGKDLRKALWGMLLDLANQDQEEAARILEKQTSFEKDGKTVQGFKDPFNQRISDKWITAAYGKIKKLWEPNFAGPPQDREPGQDG